MYTLIKQLAQEAQKHMLTPPFTPQKRFWLLRNLLETFAIEHTHADVAAEAVSYTVNGCQLIVQGAFDAPLLVIEYQGSRFATLSISDTVEIDAQVAFTLRGVGNFPRKQDYAAPLALLGNLLGAGRKLIKEYQAMS